MSFKIGQIIDGYRILAELGNGGNGIVYKALSIQDGHTIAIKIPWKERIKKDPRLANNFLRETSAIARLEHPNIAKYYHAGTYHIEDNDESVSLPYITMEFVEGISFAELTTTSIRQRVIMMQKVAEAVAYAHGKGVIHRDLKPTNIILANGNIPKILDFGLARLMDEITTHAAIFEGSPDFAAPEQFKGETCDERTDIWTLGVILFYILSKRAPFSPPDEEQLTDIQRVFAIQEQVLKSPTPKPSKYNNQIDNYLDAICLKALAKDPKARYQSAEEMATALQQWGRINRDLWIAKAQSARKWCQFMPGPLKRQQIKKIYQYIQIALSYATATTVIKDFIQEILALENILNIAILEMPLPDNLTASQWKIFSQEIQEMSSHHSEYLIPIQKAIIGISEGEEIPHQVLLVYCRPQGQSLREQIGRITTELAYELAHKIAELVELLQQKGCMPGIPDPSEIFIQPIQILAIGWPFRHENTPSACELAKLLYYILTGMNLPPEAVDWHKLPEKFREPIQQAIPPNNTIINIQDFLDALERNQEARKILENGLLDRPFLFPPGEYVLDKTLRIEKNGHLKLQSSTRFLVSPNVSIECAGQITAHGTWNTETESGTIYFGPFKSKEGWAGIHILPQNDKLHSIEGCTFEGGRGSVNTNGHSCGGALYLEGGKLILRNVSFKDNHVEDDGGAILIISSTPTEIEMHQTVFQKNMSGHYGGALAIHCAGKALIEECRFDNNRSGEDGGAISLRGNNNQALDAFIAKSILTENRAQTSGGAICTSFFTHTCIETCQIESNQAEDSAGAILIIGRSEDTTTLILRDSKLGGNRCAIRGGALTAKKHTSLGITACSFDGNSSDRDSGGAIFLDGKTGSIPTKAIISETSFVENRCRIDGGAINSNINTETQFENCRFDSNSAEDNGGGAITIVGENAQNFSSSQFISCNFTRNRCRMNGGAVNAYLFTKTAFEKCRFKNNSAEDSGGACEIVGEEGPTASESNFSKVIFSGNRCKMSGGAINALDCTLIMLEQCQFENNRSEEDGGAFYIKGADTSRYSDVALLNCIFLENRSRQGSGALHFHHFSRAKIDACKIKGNYAEGKNGGAIQVFGARGDRPTEVTIVRSHFLENFAKMDAGAFYLGDYALAIFEKIRFERNKSENNGGCLALNGRESEYPTKITFRHTYFIDNHSNNDGGAISAGNHIRMILVDCRLLNNNADGSCGAVGIVGKPDSQPSKAKFTRVLFSHNHCKNDGGAIAAALRCQMIFEECQFDGNWSDSSCGAIGLLGKDKNNLSDATFYKVKFTGNHCIIDGGAMVIGRYSRTKFEKCIFEENYVEKKTGGAILILGKDSSFASIADFQTVIFRRNHCWIDGGAINANIYTQVSFKSCLFEENVARKKNGGAIVLLGKDGQCPTKSSFVQVTFRRNQCQVSGGAINANDFTRSHFVDCLFEENRAQTKNGGAVLVLGQDNKFPSDAKFSKVVFRKNYCFASGGAVNANIFTISMFENCTFEKNIAEENGGGIFIRGLKRIPNKATVRSCRFVGNVAGKIGPDVALNAVKGVTQYSLLHDNTTEIQPDFQAEDEIGESAYPRQLQRAEEMLIFSDEPTEEHGVNLGRSNIIEKEKSPTNESSETKKTKNQ